jgi:hypothetical protein
MRMKSSTVLVIVIIIIAGLVALTIYNDINTKPPPTGSHAYIGAIYKGTRADVNSIYANLSIGGENNLDSVVYYVVLSAWDSNNSYDQVGIASLYGRLYSTYSYTVTLKNGSIKYIFDNHWFSVKEGEHQIEMSISDGNVTFIFDKTSITEFTGGDYFIEATNILINSTSYSDLTVYEEIYGFNKTLPGLSFNFTNIGVKSVNLSQVRDWSFFEHNASRDYSSTVHFYGNAVNISNMMPAEIQNLGGSGVPTGPTLKNATTEDSILVNSSQCIFPLNWLYLQVLRISPGF